MKKYIIPIAAALCLLGCNKQIPDDGADIDKSGHTLFSVDIENLSIGGGQIPGKWNDGDRIGVFGSELGKNVPYYLKRGGEGLQAAAFYGGVVKGNVLAYAPYEDGVEDVNGAIPCYLEHEQEFAPDAGKAEWFLGYNPRTFAVPGADEILHFQYPMGLMAVHFDFTDPVLIYSISLSSTKGLSGWMSIGPDGNVQPSDISHKEINLNLKAKSVSTKTDGKSTEFLFALPPGKYTDGSLSINAVTPDEEIVVNIHDVEVKRVDSADFPVVDVTIHTSDIPAYDKIDGYLE